MAATVEKGLLDATKTDDSLPSELGMYSKDINIPHLAVQLKMLPDRVRACNENNPAIKDCIQHLEQCAISVMVCQAANLCSPKSSLCFGLCLPSLLPLQLQKELSLLYTG